MEPGVDSSVPLEFVHGFSLISVPFSDQPHYNRGFAQAIEDAGGAVSSIS